MEGPRGDGLYIGNITDVMCIYIHRSLIEHPTFIRQEQSLSLESLDRKINGIDEKKKIYHDITSRIVPSLSLFVLEFDAAG